MKDVKKPFSKGIVLDIGTGDGEFVYKLAEAYSEKLFVGVDTNHSALQKISNKIERKKEKGGLNNALYLLASAQSLLPELKRSVNQVFIIFPWGSLLSDLINVEKELLRNLRSAMKRGAYLDIILGYDSVRDRSEIQRYNLPSTLNEKFIVDEWIPNIEKFGFCLIKSRQLNIDEISKLPSSWAKRLRSDKKREYFYVRIQAV